MGITEDEKRKGKDPKPAHPPEVSLTLMVWRALDYNGNPQHGLPLFESHTRKQPCPRNAPLFYDLHLARLGPLHPGENPLLAVPRRAIKIRLPAK